MKYNDRIERQMRRSTRPGRLGAHNHGAEME